ncbi:MAG: hypothetical protein WCT42_00085 [Candidatus Paceibacterota bacterium]|jgi:hypothetical protein
MENFTNAEDLNKRTIATQEKIEAGGKDAREAYFELNNLAQESENVRDEAEIENREFNEKSKIIKDGTQEKVGQLKSEDVDAFLLEVIKESKEYRVNDPIEILGYINDFIELYKKEKEGHDYKTPFNLYCWAERAIELGIKFDERKVKNILDEAVGKNLIERTWSLENAHLHLEDKYISRALYKAVDDENEEMFDKLAIKYEKNNEKSGKSTYLIENLRGDLANKKNKHKY